MKKYTIFFILLAIFESVNGQDHSGKFVYDTLYSRALENDAGEKSTRRVSVYLPPDYELSDVRYPVVYYLHGITQSDSSLITNYKIENLLNEGINKGKIRPAIFVISDQYTLYRGSFYTNSQLTGKWSDFTASDLVNYIDERYRSIPNRESRGIAGHSMGGHGALKLGMLFPEVFANVYALSPFVLGLEKDFGPNARGYQQAQMIQSREDLIDGFRNIHANSVVAAGRAFSPNFNKPPFYADLPYSYDGDSLVVNSEALDLWKKNLPYEMIQDYTNQLESLNSIKLDWGRNDQFTHIPSTSRKFSEKLEEYSINHFAEEYNGSHIDKVYTYDGRFINEMLPFFNTYLNFE